MSRSQCYKQKFVCPECGVEKNLYVWSDRLNNPICLDCEEEFVEVVEETKGEGPSIMRFNSLSPHEKRAVLKKRSHEHYKKHIKEKKEYMDRNYDGKSNI